MITFCRSKYLYPFFTFQILCGPYFLLPMQILLQILYWNYYSHGDNLLLVTLIIYGMCNFVNSDILDTTLMLLFYECWLGTFILA
jgi:hypothetical protein